MLTSHLQNGLYPARHQSLSSAVAMRTSTTHHLSRSSGVVQTRSHWGWRRPGDYSSHIDPMFHRFVRFRSLKTRAKQIDKLRRRGRWDWNASERPFFNGKHVRFASHFGSPKYHPRKLDSDTKKSQSQEPTEEDSFELTEGEKEWKEHMKRLRKRIEQDPYEAVFGKRFTPFWSPLLSPLARWTHEELGQTTDQTTDAKSTSDTPKKTQTSAKPNMPSGKERDVDADTPNGQLTNYSYSASTAWDSKTNKTRGREWDSVSGVVKTFEYDPITNRMVQIQESPQPDSSKKTSNSVVPSSKSEFELKQSEETRALPPKELRKAIEVPTANVDQANKTSVYFPSLLNTSISSKPPKTSAITKAPENDLDLLTAEDIRASMRVRQDRAHYSTRSYTSEPRTLQPALQRMQTKEIPEPEDPDDSAAHESTGDTVQSSSVPRNWDQQADLLQANRILRTRGAANDTHVTRTPYENDSTLKPSGFRAPTVYTGDKKTEEIGLQEWHDEHPRVPVDNDTTFKPAGFIPPTLYANGRKVEENGRAIDEYERRPVNNDPALNPSAHFKPPTVFSNGRKVKENGREIEIDELARTPFDNDPTMDRDNSTFKPPTIYSGMNEDECQPRMPYTNDPTVDRNAKFKPPTMYMDGRQVEGKREMPRDSSDSKPREFRSAYDAYIAADKQSKYQQKIADLKRDLDLSYEQSTINSEMHVERIRELERALQKAHDANPAKAKGPEHIQAEGDFDVANVTKYAKDSSKWYKQPAHQPAVTTPSTQHKVKPSAPAASAPVVPRDVVVNNALARQEKEHGIIDHKATEQDTADLLKEMAEKDRQIRETRAGRNPFLDPLLTKVDKEMAEKNKFKPEDTKNLLAADAQREKEWSEYIAKKKTQSKNDAFDIKWAEPPVYKVLAYDSGNDMFSTATTSSNFTTHESPISIQDALSQLYQPARFVPHFAELQKEGYQVIYGTKDLLLFKKREDVKPSLVDHGLVKNVDRQAEPLTSLVEPVSSRKSEVNPVDGTVAEKEFGKERYVSPNRRAENGREDHQHNNQRVYREERVFSGRKKGGRHRSELTAEEIELLRRLKGNGSGWGSRLRWALGVGLGASAVAYGVGSVVEGKERRERERWEDVLAGRRRSS